MDRSNVEDIKKTFLFDLDKLHSVIPAAAGDQSAGQFALDIERTVNASGADRKRVVTYTLTNFVPVYGDPHGPQSGDIDFVEEPGVGGAMLYSTSLVFFCPANPSNLAADSDVYARWYVGGSTVAGRADARATGGRIRDRRHVGGVDLSERRGRAIWFGLGRSGPRQWVLDDERRSLGRFHGRRKFGD